MRPHPLNPPRPLLSLVTSRVRARVRVRSSVPLVPSNIPSVISGIFYSGIIPATRVITTDTRIIPSYSRIVSSTRIISTHSRIVSAPGIIPSPGIKTILDPHILPPTGIAAPVNHQATQNSNNSEQASHAPKLIPSRRIV